MTHEEKIIQYIDALHTVCSTQGYKVISVSTLTDVVRAYINKYQPPGIPTNAVKPIDRAQLVEKLKEVPLFTARPKNVLPFKRKTESK